MTHSEGDRIYCFMVGAVVRAIANGHCPECGKHSSTHRKYEGTDCGGFTECPLCSQYQGLNPRARGHHCTLPEGHAGPHTRTGFPEAEEDTFLAEVYRMHATHETDRALDMIFHWFDQELKSDRASRCNLALERVDVSALDEDLLIGFLTASFAARRLLPARTAFADKAVAKLSGEIGEVEARALIAELPHTCPGCPTPGKE